MVLNPGEHVKLFDGAGGWESGKSSRAKKRRGRGQCGRDGMDTCTASDWKTPGRCKRENGLFWRLKCGAA